MLSRPSTLAQALCFGCHGRKAVFTVHGAHGLKILLGGLLIWPKRAADVASFPSDPRLNVGAVGGAIRLHSTDSREVHGCARSLHPTRCFLAYLSAGPGRSLPGPAEGARKNNALRKKCSKGYITKEKCSEGT